MFWLWVSNSMYFASPVQGGAKWEDTWTADRTWPGLFLANLLLKSQPVCILLLWHFPWPFLPLLHPWWLGRGHRSLIALYSCPTCVLLGFWPGNKVALRGQTLTVQSRGGATFTSRSYELSIAQIYWHANRHSNPRDQTQAGLGKARAFYLAL